MRDLPVPDPGEPDHRSPARYLWWLARVHGRTMVGAISFGIIWMVAQSLMPAIVGRAVDALTRNETRSLAWASVTLLGLGVVQAFTGLMRHRFAVANWLGSAYRTVQVTVRQVTRLGATLSRRVATGEVVSIGTSDIQHIGDAIDVVARGSGAVAAIVVVAVVLLNVSLPLGLVVIIGVPVLVGTVALLLRPLHGRQQAHRELSGELTNRATDIVAGLRVLRGVGGEAAFADRYRAESQRVRTAGVRVSRVHSWLEGAQILLPGIFVVLVTWLGARFAVAGAITPGQLVAFYGYAAFLVFPLRTLTEAADKLTRGHVAARRVVRLLDLRPEVSEPAVPAVPPKSGELTDPESGATIRPGLFTAIAAARAEDAVAIAERLGRFDPDSRVRLSGVPLADLPVAAVRERILLADNDARLFGGRLRDQLAPAGLGDLAAAVDTACAGDILAALPDGLDTEIAQRGREFSGGQLQRLRLVRALVADPPVLVMVEPTSAVDAHTEARIAARLRAARGGRTTVVCCTSPLLLDRADQVLFVEGGRVVAIGRHRELLDSQPRYALTVTRGEEL